MKSVQMYEPQSKIIPVKNLPKQHFFVCNYLISVKFKSGMLFISSICAKRMATLPSAGKMVGQQQRVASLL